MKRYFTFFVLLSLYQSCSDHDRNSLGDLQYTIVEDKNGKNIEYYDFVSLSYETRTETGELLNSNYGIDSRPLQLYRVHPYFKGDLHTALGLLSAGDSAQLKINADSLHKYYGFPENIEGNHIVYNIKVHEVITRGNLSDSLLNAKIEEFKLRQTNSAKENEHLKIRNFIVANKLNPDSTTSGIYYTIIKKGVGKKPKIGAEIYINYIISDLNGKVIQTNLKETAISSGIYTEGFNYQPHKEVISQNPASGFSEGASMFPIGTKAKLIIPSKLAYGDQGNGIVHPYAPIICDMEIIEKK